MDGRQYPVSITPDQTLPLPNSCMSDYKEEKNNPLAATVSSIGKAIQVGEVNFHKTRTVFLEDTVFGVLNQKEI